jgi:hypothetical protein
MRQDDCSRRVFLKKFALLSAGSLMLGATAIACYGPGSLNNSPSPSPAVSGMFFLDPASNPIPLQNNQSVPVHTRFTIEFSVQMNTAVAAAVAFADNNDVPVPFDKAWDNDFTVSVVPSSNLLFNTQYRLRVLNAESKQGGKLIPDANAEATFRTVVA